ncbi:bifunctional adenosylcobinamide kinase/adenosylcobinamide-phosphate guanylyltransferase [Aureimonas populi]|uniref:Bifunctional adenosylcobalamin biosynthesis protein n=1 Tax=Aureimonas populi TaxID=1701758 RepID=A0ABW5CJ89_9HYPH|nr:bifunctional adenosylcobinamide kinase/adenosylcobinamide-phosphate guanylyltransferase [Aureimonas populi]
MTTGALTLVLGGARSGKSRHAESLVQTYAPPFLYIATAQAHDAEMEARIALHRQRRDGRWRTLDAPLDPAGVLQAVPEGAPLLLDCLTLWLSNVMLAERDVEAEIARLTQTLAAPRGPWVVVSSEVGLGIVPDNALARRFRDAAGRLNQEIAAVAGAVVLTVAGLPMKVK